ncbi:hypothetical protein BBF96_01765 [Anoxybacter fermentans]|uniref:Uncharacterized protein n=1 Tax=Anoxybacter fermentans TaxID=1323375 RepID=A0A3S9SVD2_9FIRM|nr:hypothetical protein [Anoxybacter fermentans]AZR72234.1 hypothetical protein BBF96_01765 [Anoxybacter fermentans]
MQLLVMVVDKEEDLDEIFEAFIDIGIKGVTVLDSYGSGHLFTENLSIFGKLSSIADGRKKHNKTIFSIIEDPEKLEEAIEVVENIVGDLNQPHTAVLFTVPLGIVRGLTN